MDEEMYSLNTDGTVTFQFGGITRVLRRPTLGQYRERMEALGGLRDNALETATDARGLIKVQMDASISWFDETFQLLAGEGLPRREDDPDTINEDRLPVWLLSGELVTELVTHWQERPSRRGGQ